MNVHYKVVILLSIVSGTIMSMEQFSVQNEDVAKLKALCEKSHINLVINDSGKKQKNAEIKKKTKNKNDEKDAFSLEDLLFSLSLL